MDMNNIWSIINNQQFKEIFVLVVIAIFASLFIVIETANKNNEPGAVMRTRAWWVFWVINATVAFVVICAIIYSKDIKLGFAGGVAVVLGYPMLLRSKLFTIPGSNNSFGFDYILQITDKLFLDWINDSLDIERARLITKWKEADFNKLAKHVTNYLQACKSGDAVLPTVEGLITDVTNNPQNRENNAGTIFIKVENCKGLRGIRYILKMCK